MMRLYLYDDQRISTGEHVDIEDVYAPVPANATHVQPPETVGDEVAHWNGKVWTVLPERPPAPVPDPVPQSVTMRQARLALLGSGKLADVDTAIAGLPEPERTAAQIEWEYSQEVHRDKPFVAMLAPALGLTEEALDDLFRVAATL